MRSWLMATGVAVALVATTASAWAEAVQKIGFVDTDRVYRESKDAQSINKTLEQEFGSQFKHLRKLEKQGAELQKLLLSNKLSADEQKRQQERMAKINKEYLALKSAVNEEYSLRRNEEFASMQQKANQALIELAKAENYDVIVKDVVYVRSDFDITDKLIKIMNRN
jgi:outer membrane protein